MSFRNQIIVPQRCVIDENSNAQFIDSFPQQNSLFAQAIFSTKITCFLKRFP